MARDRPLLVRDLGHDLYQPFTDHHVPHPSFAITGPGRISIDQGGESYLPEPPLQRLLEEPRAARLAARCRETG